MEGDEEVQTEAAAQTAREFRQKVAAYEYRSPSSSPAKATRSTRANASVSAAKDDSEAGPSTPLKRPRANKSTRSSARLDADTDADDEVPAVDSDDDCKTARHAKRRRKSNSASSQSPSPRKGKKPSRPYAPPETYAHLHMLPDYLDYGLDGTLVLRFPPDTSAKRPHSDVLRNQVRHSSLGLGLTRTAVADMADLRSPGVTSAERGHHYAHSTNHFWECLYKSGLTDTQLPPEEDYTLPERYHFGLVSAHLTPFDDCPCATSYG